MPSLKFDNNNKLTVTKNNGSVISCTLDKPLTNLEKTLLEFLNELDTTPAEINWGKIGINLDNSEGEPSAWISKYYGKTYFNFKGLKANNDYEAKIAELDARIKTLEDMVL